MYQFHKKKLPSILMDFYTFNRDVHGRTTKSSDLIHIPNIKHCKSLVRQRAIRFVGASCYNHFFKKVNIEVEASTYKKNLKKYLLDLNLLDVAKICKSFSTPC